VVIMKESSRIDKACRMDPCHFTRGKTNHPVFSLNSGYEKASLGLQNELPSGTYLSAIGAIP